MKPDAIFRRVYIAVLGMRKPHWLQPAWKLATASEVRR